MEHNKDNLSIDAKLLFDRLLRGLSSSLQLSKDKPEETIESTLRACWFAAQGNLKSAEEALKQPLTTLNKDQTQVLEKLIGDRLDSKPLAYITARQNFMGLELISDKRALIPRKETEILGKKALDISFQITQTKKVVRVMDLCCGGGNLAVSIGYHNPNSIVFATDLSPESVELANDNISHLNLNHRVKAAQGDLFSAFENSDHYKNTDVIICNPPYISSAKVTKMDVEISRYEPAMAFDGGMFGTNIIQRLILESPKFLYSGGWLLFEVGAGQGDFLTRLCQNSGNYKTVESVCDDLGNIRVVAAQTNNIGT